MFMGGLHNIRKKKEVESTRSQAIVLCKKLIGECAHSTLSR